MSYNEKRNASGCYDPTAYYAIKKADAEAELERFHKVLDTLRSVCELSDFSIEGRVVLRDKRTGRIWR